MSDNTAGVLIVIVFTLFALLTIDTKNGDDVLDAIVKNMEQKQCMNIK